MSLRDLKTGFELDDDMLGTAAGGAFSDIRTNVQIVYQVPAFNAFLPTASIILLLTAQP